MNAVNTLCLSVGLAMALAMLSLFLLRRSFLRLLVELCGSEVQGTFWFVFACIAIALTTLLGSLLAFGPGEFERWREVGALDAALASFRAGLLGLVFALGGVALGALVSMAQGSARYRAGAPPISRPSA